jgi:hypothetical protein
MDDDSIKALLRKPVLYIEELATVLPRRIDVRQRWSTANVRTFLRIEDS